MFKSNTSGLNSLKQKLVKTITFASIGALLALSLAVFKQGQVQGAPSTTLNFQARLLNANGTLVQDGNYHIEFKLYNQVSGGTALWTETRTTGSLVTIKNGFLSVYLGSVTPFPGSIEWSEEHWLTMNIGGAGGAAAWDGEMAPRIKLTAVPYAFQAEQLAKTEGDGNRGVLGFDTLSANRNILLPDASGTVCLQNSVSCGFLTGSADDYIQNGTSPQAGATFNIAAGVGEVAATIQGAASQNILVLNQSNGTTNALTVQADGDAAFDTNVLFVDAVNNRVGIGNTAPSAALEVTGDIYLSEAGNRTIRVENRTATTGTGHALSILGSNGNEGAGGAISITGGSAVSAAGNFGGGAVNIQGGEAVGFNTGGGVNITGGGGLVGGHITINGGAGFQRGNITLQAADPNGLVGIATSSPTNTLSVSPRQYNTGTASQSGTTVTGVGTTWTSAMVGSELIFANGTKRTVTAFTDATHLEVTPSGTVSAQAYAIHYAGLQVTNAGRVGIGTTAPAALFSVGSSSQLQVDASGNLQLDGNGIFGNAAADMLTLNGTAVSIPNNLNFDSNTLTIDATQNTVGIGVVATSNALTIGALGSQYELFFSGDNDSQVVAEGNLYLGFDSDNDPGSAEFAIYTDTTTEVFGVSSGGNARARGSITSGTAALQGSLVLNDGNGQTATIQVEDNTLAANTIISIPSSVGTSDTFCLETLGNCTGATSTFQDIYNNDADGSNVVVDLNSTDGSILFRDNSTPLGGTLFAIQNSTGSTSYLDVAVTGLTTSGDLAVNGGDVTSTTSLNVTASNGALTLTSTGAGNDIVLNSADTIELQDNTNVTGNLDVSGKVIVGDAPVLGLLAGLEVGETFGNSDNCLLGCAASIARGFMNNNTGGVVAQYVQTGVTAGTANSTAGIIVANPSLSGGGAITFNTGVNVGAQTSGTNNVGVLIGEATGTKQVNLLIGVTPDATWSNIPTTAYSIYNASTNANYFGGALGIGDASPDAQFTVGSTSQFQVNSTGAVAAATGITSSGTITFSGLNCSANANGGAITANASGVLSCTDDNDSTANAFIQGGNDFNATAVLGTTDVDDLTFITSNTTRLTVNATTGNATFTGDLIVNGGDVSSSTSLNVTASNGALTLTSTGTGNDIVLNSADAIELQDNTNVTGNFDVSGTLTVGTSNAFQVSSTGGVTAVGASIAGAIINLNASSNFNTNINTGNSTGVVSIGNNLGNPTINIDSGTSAINIGTGAQSRSIAIGTGGGASSQTVTIGSQTSASQLNLHAGTNNINLTASGTSNTGVIIQHTSDSTNALLIRDSGADVLFRADTSNNRLYVGNQTASSGADSTLLIVDSASTANLPTGVNGGIVYDSTDNKFKIYENGAYKTLCNMTDLGCGAGASVDLQGVYNNSVTTGTIATTSTTKDIIFKSGVGFDDTTMFLLQNGAGQNLFVADTANQRVAIGPAAVPANGVLTIGTNTTANTGGIFFGTDTNLFRSAANTLRTNDALTVDGLLTGSAGATVSGAAINLNNNSNFATNINTGTSTGAVTIGNNTGNTAVTINSGTGTIAIGTGAQARTVQIANGAAAQALTLGSTNTTSSTLIQGGTGNITLTANGGSNTGTIVGNTNNSTNAFRIQSSGSDVLFRADTTNNRVYVGNATASSSADSTLLVVDSASTANLPTGVNGGIVYDSTDNKFKIYEGGAWKTLCNTTDLGCGVAGANQTLQDAYDNSSPATIETSSSTKNIIFRSGSGFDSTGIFQIQDSGSDTLFRADTVNNRVYVGNSTGASLADSTLFVVDSVADTDYLTSAVNGGMIYDDETDKFMIYEGGAWKTLCNTTDLGCGGGGVTQSLQDAYNNSSSPATIETTSNTKDIIIKSGLGFDSDSMFMLQNGDDETLLVADTVNMRLSIGENVSPANGVLTVGSNTTTASGGIYFGTDTNLYRSAAGTLRTDGNLQLGEGSDRTFEVQGRSTNAAGNGLTISAGDAGAGGSAFGGGALTLQGGDAAGTGDANGGNIILNGGAGTGNGARGLVVLGTPTFTTTLNDANCFAGGALVASSCTITTSSVSNSSAIVVGFSQDGQTATLPDPINTTAGRIIYITGANGSSDFTLSVNGGVGQGNQIAMRANTSATMIWNGNDWTAAGASSSTTLQAAYNNTLTSAGGAEIVLNNTASSNGLTIRNNGSSPITGGIFEVQSSVGTNLFSVNNRGTELAANGGSETEDTWATNWEAVGSGTASRTTTSGEYVTGTAGAELVTAAPDDGIQNNLSGSPVNTVGAKYQVSFTAKSSINGTPVEVVYSRDGGTTETLCADYVDGGDISQSLSDTDWTKVTCTITIDSATAATDPVLIIRKTNGGTPTIWIDNLSFMRNDATTAPSNVQIGGGLDGGPITLFTLDRASAPPVADGDTTYLGSMYYDTITGRIQCYEADGWGACGSAPNNFVNLTPEYAGAVLNGSGVGTMTADFCSNGTLSVNSSICSSGQAQNFYKWTSPQANMQKYSIYVTYQLPAAFKNFDSNNTVTLTARIDSTTNADVTFEMYRSEGGSLVQCGTGETDVTSTANAWQTVGINGDEADFSSCGFSTASANSNVVFKINVYAKSNASAYVGNLSFTTIGQ